jgi:hypothetical protein
MLIYEHVCMCVHPITPAHTHTHTHTHTPTHTPTRTTHAPHAHTLTLTLTHTRTHTRTHARARTHTHTHTIYCTYTQQLLTYYIIAACSFLVALYYAFAYAWLSPPSFFS